MVFPHEAFAIVILLFALISYIGEVFAYDECYSTSSYVYYCEDGYHCCNNNQDCCAGDPGLSGGAIAGIVIGCIVGLAIVVTVLHYCSKKTVQVGMVDSAPQRVQVTTLSLDPPTYSQTVYPRQNSFAPQNPVNDYKNTTLNPDSQQNSDPGGGLTAVNSGALQNPVTDNKSPAVNSEGVQNSVGSSAINTDVQQNHVPGEGSTAAYHDTQETIRQM